ncbi:MAG: FecR family protein [Bacteroidales bacterium]|nr:FecR family protein [Bacteroidales bacterium]
MNSFDFNDINENIDSKILDIDVDQEWNKLSSELGFSKKGKILRFDLFIKIAATVVLLLGIGYFINYANFNNNVVVFESQNIPLETIVENSTQISLNRNSKIECSKSDNNTFSVNLKGEAYFDVEKNPSRSFQINTKDIQVIVHGTSFDICENKSNTIVTVTSGIVEVLSNKIKNSSVKLTKGQQLICDKDGNFKTLNAENFNNIAWKLKQFEFNNASLSEIMYQLGYAYNFGYKFENTDLKSIKISGSFSNQEISSILNIIQQSLDNVEIVFQNNFCIIKNRCF